MIIVAADDYGRNARATDSILACFSAKRITCAGAMVFMEDSKRAALLAGNTNLEVGLHLNFTLPYNGPKVTSRLREHQSKIVHYLTKRDVSHLVYNPFLSDSFRFVLSAQQEEFFQIYGHPPIFYNGHHHMHLCANVLLGKMIPRGARVRKTFTFYPGEKSLLNRLYRYWLNTIISKRFISTDRFFSISPYLNTEFLKNILDRSACEVVEIEVHPENPEEEAFLLSEEYGLLLNSMSTGSFRQLRGLSE